MRVFGIVKKVLKGQPAFSDISAVPVEQTYILNLGTEVTERVQAFPCPCTPTIYLQAQPQRGYTKVSIIVLATNVSTPSEYPESRSSDVQSYKFDAKKVKYKKRAVSDITEGESLSTIHVNACG